MNIITGSPHFDHHTKRDNIFSSKLIRYGEKARERERETEEQNIMI